MARVLPFRYKRLRYNPIRYIILIGLLTITVFIDYNLTRGKYIFTFQTFLNRFAIKGSVFYISPNVHIVDLHAPVSTKFQCMKTKKLLKNISTNICLYEKEMDKHVSGVFHESTSIYEEAHVIRILQLLVRHPHLDFIDIGANIGTYTMFAAALGRFVLAIDCFAPNLVRIRRAAQLTNATDRVVLVQNALFTHSGQSLELSFEKGNIGGQSIIQSSINRSHEHVATDRLSTSNLYIVKTITFDEVLPILLAYDVRGALMKIDIEGSESFVVENGSQVFDTLNIPFVQMEWKLISEYADRVEVMFNFFNKRDYYPMTDVCKHLNLTQYKLWPNEIFWLKRNSSVFC
jgi:FkbM family methyltransferase